jgi:signal transduction histidine kinase
MSHELRTPLNAIIGYEDLLNMEVGGPVNADQRKYLGRIRSGAHQLLRLIDQVLSLARIEAGREDLTIESVDVIAVATETAALVEPIVSKKGLTLAVRTPSEAAFVDTDAGKLRQILLNLLSNAAKFTSEGGIHLDIRVDAGVVTFAVGDTGVGIDLLYLDKIFDPFVQVDNSATRHFEGTGLGLSVSRHLARLLGGDIEVASVPGNGSVFTLRIPAQRPILISTT